MTGWIITGLLVILCAVIAGGSFLFNHERKKHEKELERVKQQEAKNAQNAADAVTKADKIKESANTGNLSDDLRTMANQLREYADGGR